jgi:hypothetical protein
MTRDFDRASRFAPQTYEHFHFTPPWPSEASPELD